MYVQNYLLAFWQRLVWLDCVRYMMCRVPLCPRSSRLTCSMDTGWSQSSRSTWGTCYWVSKVDLSVSRSCRRFNNGKCPSFVKCGCTHADEHLLVQKCFMFSSSVCVKCSAPVGNRREEHRLDKSTVESLFYTLAVDFTPTPIRNNTNQAKHYGHTSKHCVLQSSVWTIWIKTVSLESHLQIAHVQDKVHTNDHVHKQLYHILQLTVAM